MFHAAGIEEGGGKKRLVQLGLACEAAYGVASPDPSGRC